MRIGIYADTAADPEPRGIGFYVVNLINALARQSGDHQYYLYYRRDLSRRDIGLPRVVPAANIILRPIRYPKPLFERYPRLWWDRYLPFCIWRDSLDVFHGPNFFLPLIQGPKTVVTIHDLAFFKLDLYSPEVTAAYKHWTLTSLKRASQILAISESTRRDILSLGVDEGRVNRIYSGGGNYIPAEQFSQERVLALLAGLRLTRPFILFVGTLHPRKNVPFLLRAFAALKKRGIPHQLVLAGKKDSASEEIDQLIEKLSLKGEVIVTGYLDDLSIRMLYQKADLFVLPSRYEGFGMIVQEAMMYNVPVITTQESALPEVVGNGGLLVSSDDDAGLTLSMHRVLTDPSLRDSLIERGRLQAKRFTWERCAKDTLALYESMSQRQQQSRKVPA